MKNILLFILLTLFSISCEKEMATEDVEISTICHYFDRLEIDTTSTTRLDETESYFIKGFLDGEPWAAKTYSLRYRSDTIHSAQVYYNIPLYFSDWEACEWHFSLGFGDHWYPWAAIGDTVYLEYNAVGFIANARSRNMTYRPRDLISQEPYQPTNSFFIIHSVSSDTIIEGSFNIDFVEQYEPVSRHLSIIQGSFRLKPA